MISKNRNKLVHTFLMYENKELHFHVGKKTLINKILVIEVLFK